MQLLHICLENFGNGSYEDHVIYFSSKHNTQSSESVTARNCRSLSLIIISYLVINCATRMNSHIMENED
jgi:hypothetical protein